MAAPNPATATDATMPAAPKKGTKRGASQEVEGDACAICLNVMVRSHTNAAP